MTTQRYNVRNKAVGEANTKLVLASLRNGAKTMTELMMVTGLTRQTLIKKVEQLSDAIVSTESRPKRYYLKGTDLSSVVDEQVSKNNVSSKLDIAKNAILHGSDGPVFFPQATHNDYSNLHDRVLNEELSGHLAEAYREVKDGKSLANLENALKTFYDLVQFRKTLREFE